MDKNTLSNYGWIVIAVLVLSVMIALATPFGQYVENAVWSATEGLFDTSENALNIIGATANKKDLNYDNLPIFVNSIDECTNTSKKYVLPDGYLYQYTNSKLEFTDIFDIDTALLNQRIKASGPQTAYDGILTLDYVEVDMANNYTIDISSITLEKTFGYYCCVCYYDSNKNILGQINEYKLPNWVPIDNGYTFSLENSTYPNAKYIRICLAIHDGVAVTEDDVENLVVELSRAKETQEYNWNKVKRYIPADWYTEVKDTNSKIDTLKANADSNLIQFLLTSDFHYNSPNVSIIENLGKVSAEVMRDNEIPFFMNLGDTSTHNLVDLSLQKQQFDYTINTLLNPIPKSNILLTVGNHDGATGEKEVDGKTVYHRHQMTNEERAEVFFGWQKESNGNKKFGPDGSYYYIDDASTKTRYIMLNSFWNEWEGEEDGFVTNIQHSFAHKGVFGQEQLYWLANEALDVPNGYSSIIGTHHIGDPLDTDIFVDIVSAYVNKESYTGSYTGAEDWQNYTISVDFSSSKGELIAIFQGHRHWDAIDTTSYAVPVINITTSAGNHSIKDENPPTRTTGTATESAIDVVTIDKENRVIYLTRLGVGEDRVVNY